MASDLGDNSEIDENTMAHPIHEPWEVAGEIVPWNIRIQMAGWKRVPTRAQIQGQVVCDLA